MKKFDQPPEPHQVIAMFASNTVIPNARKLLEKAKTHRVPKAEIDHALDEAFRVIGQMLDAWPKEKEGHQS